MLRCWRHSVPVSGDATSQLLAHGDRAEEVVEILDPDLDEPVAESVGGEPTLADAPPERVDADTVQHSCLLE